MQYYTPLLTDQYQIVMAYSYWKLGMAEQRAVFYLSFRKLPINSPYIVAAGLQSVIDFLSKFQFTDDDLNYLQYLQGDHGKMFEPAFLAYLKELKINCDIDAVPEGTLVFEKEPVLRIEGPILQCQLIETPLLNLINFASLIATKASQVYLAANKDPVIEFGLRRAQGPDGGLTASRSAYIGGCQGTSNVLAGKTFNIPLYGTQAHSWIMAFPTELQAFEKFAQVMQSNTSLLVDTYDTLQGINHAIEIGKALKKRGEHLAGIRLDSGNLLELSKQARRLLDEAGLYDTIVMASGDLDEHIIRDLKSKDAPINAWGVGTKLVTAFDQPALNAIYKLSALKNSNGSWDYKMKTTSDLNKVTLPGILQVKRYSQGDVIIKDIIYDTAKEKKYSNELDLLQPIIRNGQLTYQLPNINDIRKRAMKAVDNFTQNNETPYPVSLSPSLQQTIEALLKEIKATNYPL